MKKIIAVLLVALMVVSMCACAQEDDGKFVVGICQLVQHEALDAATKGFRDALVQELGDKVTFEEKNASNEAAACTTIINGFVASDVDLIMANATPALQAAVAGTDKIPVLGTSVTDYASALELDGWNGTVGSNVSGTSDLAPLADQAAIIKELFPDAKNVGLLYCVGEPNSQYQVDVITGEMEDLGYTVKTFGFTDTNDVASVTQAACSASDVIYIPTDNTAAANTEAIANIVLPAKIPVVTGESGICKGCGVATLSIDYYSLGYATGLMAAKILTGEADISSMPIEYADEFAKMYNVENCATLGITIPDGYSPMN